MTKRKAAIVTGATGYVGSNLVPALLEARWEVTCIVRRESKYSQHGWHDQVKYITYDGSAESLVAGEDFRECDVVVFHLAAMAAYHCPGEMIGEMVASNITFGAHVLEAMPRWGASRLVNTGSFWQYDRSGRYHPVCLYAATKEAFEDVIAFHARRDQLQCITLVLFDVYGPRDPRRKIIQLLVEHARTGERLALSPGLQQVDLVHIADVVRAFEVAAERLLAREAGSRAPERYAVSSGVRGTLRELVAAFEQVMSVSLKVEWGGIGYRDREIMEPWEPAAADILVGWRPQYNLRAGLTDLKESLA